MTRSERLYLKDVTDAATAIASNRERVTYLEWTDDEILQRAGLRHVTDSGEAAAHVWSVTRSQMPNVEWADVVRFRNRAISSAISLDWEIVWHTAVNDAPVLKRVRSDYLRKQD